MSYIFHKLKRKNNIVAVTLQITLNKVNEKNRNFEIFENK